MLALLATIALFHAPGTESAAPPDPPAAVASPAERAAPPVPPAPPAPRAPRAMPAPPAPTVPLGDRRVVIKIVGESDPLRGDWPATPSGKEVTIDESNCVDDTMQAIAEAGGWSAVLNTGRVGERMLVLKLRNVPVEEALRAALSGTGLVATRRGNVVVVAPGLQPVSERQVLAGFDRPTGKTFSGDFEGLVARDALLHIGKAAGISIVLPEGELGRVTAHFKDAPVEEALKAVLAQAGLQGVREGSIVTVTRQKGGPLAQFDFHGELGPAIGKTVEEAMRTAEREVRRAERGAKTATRGGGQRDQQRVGGDVVVEAGEEARDVVAVGGNVTLKPGAEARDAVAVGGSVTLESGASAREAVAVGGDVKIGPGASVEKDAVSVGGRVQVDPGGDLGGQRVAVSIPGFTSLLGSLSDRMSERQSTAWSVAGVLVRYAAYFALGILLVLLFPRRVDAVAASMVANPVKSLLAGLLGLMAQPFLTILLVVTVIGIPLVLVQVLGLVVGGGLGFTALALHLGRALPLPEARRTTMLQLAIGMALLVVATQLPVLGWIVWVVLLMVTFGAVLRTRFGQEPVLATEPVQAPAPPPPPPVVPTQGAV